MVLACAAIAGCDVAQVRPPAPEPAPQSTPPPAPQSLPAEPTPAAPSLEDSEFAGLVAYSNWIRKRAPNDLNALLADAERRVAANPSPADRLRLAILLSLPQTPFRNDTRALKLADAVIDNGTDEFALYAYTLRWNLQDRGALQSQCDRALARERQERAKLKQKLDELKAIEEQLHRRETKPLKPTP